MGIYVAEVSWGFWVVFLVIYEVFWAMKEPWQSWQDERKTISASRSTWPRFWSLTLWSRLWTHFVAFSARINMYMVHSMLNDAMLLFKACSDPNSNYDGSCHKHFEKVFEQQLQGPVPWLHHILIKIWVDRYLSWYWNKISPATFRSFRLNWAHEHVSKVLPVFSILAQAPSLKVSGAWNLHVEKAACSEPIIFKA